MTEKPKQEEKTIHNLPPDMWTLPPETITSDHLKLLHAELADRLRHEAADTPGFGTVEAMMVERLVFTYISIRDREQHKIGEKDKETGANKGFEHERNYKETVQMWMQMAQGFQAAKNKAVDEKKVKEHILTKIASVISQAIQELPVSIREPVQQQMAEAFKSAEL